MKYELRGINIELTNFCPLHCSQCYCSLEGGKEIPPTRAIEVMRQAADMGASHVELSGGETMCYPHLIPIIIAARNLNLAPSISISGWHFNDLMLRRLIDAGIDRIYVSLNAPTKDLNAITRDGYEFAISALETLARNNFSDTVINWVMHRDTADTLDQMIGIAKEYHVGTILIIEPMPSSLGIMNTYPTKEQLQSVAQKVKSNKDGIALQIQHCFSPLLALASENKLWGNRNRGIYKGCTAGLASCAVNVDGWFVPCRHLEIVEKYENLIDYWENSQYLRYLREMRQHQGRLCISCQFSRFCRHCQAQNWMEEHQLYIGRKQCELYNEVIV